MTNRRTTSELCAWGALALAGGSAVGWLDLGASGSQGAALLLMLVNFSLTLPGRAPAPLIAILSSIGIPLVHAAVRNDVNAGFAIVVVPALIAAYGGRVAGRLLDTAAAGLTEVTAPEGASPHRRPMSTRFLLAVALVGIAAAGFPSVNAAVTATGHRAPTWVALVWQIMTLLGWIALTPLLLRLHRALASATTDMPGLTLGDIMTHVLVAGSLAALHAVILVTLSAGLLIPITPSWGELSRVAVTVYLPLDILAYLAILALAAASDVERHRQDAARREAALRAAMLDGRLAALRARLNPHFLFNALNSVHVLARAGRTDETARVVDGLTALLRYVLDERSVSVPLADELEFVREYLTLQQMRFGARLRYDIKHEETLEDALVPQLVLQPIVENAVEHGVASSLDGGSVRVSASREAGMLRLVVEDDGPGLAAGEAQAGIGLASTRERLAALYGGRARLSLSRTRDAGGTRVVIDLPFLEASAPPA